MYLMIDNYDSFVYNLRAYFEELGKEIIVKRSDRITMEEIEETMDPHTYLGSSAKFVDNVIKYAKKAIKE